MTWAASPLQNKLQENGAVQGLAMSEIWRNSLPTKADFPSPVTNLPLTESGTQSGSEAGFNIRRPGLKSWLWVVLACHKPMPFSEPQLPITHPAQLTV